MKKMAKLRVEAAGKELASDGVEVPIGNVNDDGPNGQPTRDAN